MTPLLRPLVSLSALIVLGCGPNADLRPDRATVSGQVTFDNRPLSGGTITFNSEEGGHRGASGMIDGDGRYRVGDAPAGSSRVAINTESIKIGNPGAYVAIPSRYHSPETSGLRTDLKAGENHNVDFALEP